MCRQLLTTDSIVKNPKANNTDDKADAEKIKILIQYSSNNTTTEVEHKASDEDATTHLDYLVNLATLNNSSNSRFNLYI